MKRFGLLLALMLSLLPVGAAAETSASGAERERLRVADDFGSDALRADSGLGALRFQTTNRLRETSTRNRRLRHSRAREGKKARREGPIRGRARRLPHGA